MTEEERIAHDKAEANVDPISGETGSHPVATGVGAALAGAATTLIAGAVAGPVGVAAALIGGSIAGGYAGKAAGEVIDPTHEENYWRDHHADQAFIKGDRPYGDYSAAYRAGYEGWATHGSGGRSFEEVEGSLKSGYEASEPPIPWEDARTASRAAWERAQQIRHAGDAGDIPGKTGSTEEDRGSG